MNRIVKKTFVLNLLQPTGKKQELIDELFSKYKEALSLVVAERSKSKKIGLQKEYYAKVRTLGIPSMLSAIFLGMRRRY